MASSNPGKAGLEAWWSLDEESGARADSHGSNNLADNATVLFDTGKKSNAADFELSNSEFLDIVDNASLSFGDEALTIGCWVKHETTAVGQTIMGKWDATADTREYRLRFDLAADRFSFFISDDGSASSQENADELGVPLNATWYFIIGWHDPDANTKNIQVDNGTVDSGAYSDGINDDVTDFLIGAQKNGGGYSGYFDGLVDEAFIYRRVLTADERTWLYNSGNGRAYNELLGSGKPVTMTPIMYI